MPFPETGSTNNLGSALSSLSTEVQVCKDVLPFLATSVTIDLKKTHFLG